MRTSLVALLIALPALASAAPPDKVWTPAPVPNVTDAAVRPADRAGTSSGAEKSAPFSDVPTGAASAGQENTAGSLPPTGAAAGPNTPNLSR